MTLLIDSLERPLRNLRISVTDRCNLRCAYCMPEEHYTWLPRRDLLTFEEILRLVDVFTELGVDRVRLTGGEPLLRSDLHVLVETVENDADRFALPEAANEVLRQICGERQQQLFEEAVAASASLLAANPGELAERLCG